MANAETREKNAEYIMYVIPFFIRNDERIFDTNNIRNERAFFLDNEPYTKGAASLRPATQSFDFAGGVYVFLVPTQHAPREESGVSRAAPLRKRSENRTISRGASSLPATKINMPPARVLRFSLQNRSGFLMYIP